MKAENDSLQVESLAVPYSVKGYEQRAQECVKFANLANDQLIRHELLKLRQTYLTIAKRLREQGFEVDPACEQPVARTWRRKDSMQ